MILAIMRIVLNVMRQHLHPISFMVYAHPALTMIGRHGIHMNNHDHIKKWRGTKYDVSMPFFNVIIPCFHLCVINGFMLMTCARLSYGLHIFMTI